MKKFSVETHPLVNKLSFDLKTSQIEIGKNDFVIMQGDTLRAIMEGIDRAFGPTSKEILFEAGKYAGQDFVKRLMEKGVKKSEILLWLAEFFNCCGWGKIYFAINPERNEIVITVENCVSARKVKSDKPVCHFIKGYFSGIYEENCNEISDCEEILCASKGDPFCEFRVLNMFEQHHETSSESEEGVCPNCGEAVAKPEKSFANCAFSVQAYICRKCGTQFKE